MHEYYRKSAGKLKKTMNGYMSLIKPELESICRKPYDDILSEIWHVYETDMLERFPFIGGNKVSGTKNLTGAYMFAAMGEVLKNYGTDTMESGHLMVMIYERNIMKMPAFVRKIMGRIFIDPKLLNKMFLKKMRRTLQMRQKIRAASRLRPRSRRKRGMISAITTKSAPCRILPKIRL